MHTYFLPFFYFQFLTWRIYFSLEKLGYNCWFFFFFFFFFFPPELEVLQPDHVMSGVVAVERAVNETPMGVIMILGDVTAIAPQGMTWALHKWRECEEIGQ